MYNVWEKVLLPSKRKTFVWHLCNVGPTSSTLVQHCIKSYKCFVFTGWQYKLGGQAVSKSPSNTVLLLSVHVGSLFGAFLKKCNHILYSASTTCLPGVGPTPWSGIGWICRVCWVNKSSYLAHRTCLLCFGSVLVHCLWHWPSVEPIWIESVVFLHLFGHCLRNSIYRACPVSSIRWLVLDQCWSRVSDSGSVLDRYWYGVSCLLGLLFYITIITTCVIIIISIYIFC